MEWEKKGRKLSIGIACEWDGFGREGILASEEYLKLKDKIVSMCTSSIIPILHTEEVIVLKFKISTYKYWSLILIISISW